ncbi:MAG: radical SAM protein [Myxococcales bacterium]|nr:radical SAM protein [Myxococcales bacterium]
MARVVLVNPAGREPVRSPLLAFGYLAASLEARGHEVKIVDAAASRAPTDQVAAEVRAAEPTLVGIHVKTLEAQPAYALAQALPEQTLVAGGPHATVRPTEPLAHGFDHVIVGEAERALPDLLERPAHLTPTQDFLRDLDALPSPLGALHLFDPKHYTCPVYSGLLSSRGCPEACTFCANQVTGRSFRFRSAESVAREAAALRDQHGITAFAFFDDSFAVGRRRVRELCSALAPLGMHFTCTAHPAHLDREILTLLARAGCTGIDLGVESGDSERLLRIGKGVTTTRVLEVLADAARVGITTVVNVMVGWPGETERELEGTLRFIERARPLAGGFNARGVLVPHPGTPEYELHHEAHGFTEWWLREPPLPYAPFPTEWSTAEVRRAYATDPALDRNFYELPPAVLVLAREVLEKKAAYTLEKLAAPPRVPAAGAR